VSYWRLGELSGTTAADSKGTNTGTYTGGFTLGQTGAIVNDTNTAVLLNGTTGYISVPDNNSLDLANGPLTLEAWIKLSATGNFDGIICKGNGAYYFRKSTDGSLHFLRDSGADLAGSTRTITDTTTWHYVVVTYAGANGAVTFYVDGLSSGSSSPASNLVNTAYVLTIGRRSTSATEFFHGSIDEVAVYNVALSAATVSAHYAAGIGAP
jgi:Concanavalin A-like lectin/glucanases superfamily